MSPIQKAFGLLRPITANRHTQSPQSRVSYFHFEIHIENIVSDSLDHFYRCLRMAYLVLGHHILGAYYRAQCYNLQDTRNTASLLQICVQLSRVILSLYATAKIEFLLLAISSISSLHGSPILCEHFLWPC